MSSAALAFDGAAAAAIPVFFLAAVVQESRRTEVSGFWWVLGALLVAAIGETFAFGSLALDREHASWRTAVIAGLLVSGLFVAVRLLLSLAKGKVERGAVVATLLAGLTICAYAIKSYR